MQYRELCKRNVFIAVKEEKIRQDIEDFFSEMTLQGYLSAESVEEMNSFLEKKNEEDILLIAAENYDAEALSSYKKGVDFLDMEDLFLMTDEMETFYIDKMKGDRKIVVYGGRESVEVMKIANPNLRIDKIVFADEENALDQLKKEREKDHIFVIAADNVTTELKGKLEKEADLKFGEEFHFYNKRIPKHPTSYYLKKTIFDEPKYNFPCDDTKRALSIKKHGTVMACCSAVSLAFGSILYTSVEEVLRSIPAQIVWLSIKNRTYSFCGEMCFVFRDKRYHLTDRAEIFQNKRLEGSIPQLKDFIVQLGYDRSCNLACPSCRTCRITRPEDNEEVMSLMHEEVRRMALLRPKNIRIGNGEVFFSPYYKDIIFNCYEKDSIALISNGILFNEENWDRLKKQYKKIYMEFSIDSTTPETYRRLRGGDFSLLCRNMEFAAGLRRKKELERLSISFVIQKENFREMPDFVRFGQKLGADYIAFRKLNNWGFMSDEEFIPKDVYDERNEEHEAFVEILKNPLLHLDIVHVDNIENYMKR